jgi:hypothetical protein
MRSKPPRWAIRDCSEPEDDTDTIAASALRDKLAGCVARFGAFSALRRRSILNSPAPSGAIWAPRVRSITTTCVAGFRRPPSQCRSSRCHQATGSRCTAKEISFILDGKTWARCWEKGERYDITLGRGDLVVLPPFLQDEVFNEGDNICHRTRQAAAATSAVQRPGAFEAAGGYSKSTTRTTVADRTPEGSPHLGQSVGRKATAYSLPCPVHTGERRLTEAIAGAQA